MREKLIDAFNLWLKVDQDKLDVIKQIITKLHTASLLYVMAIILRKFKNILTSTGNHFTVHFILFEINYQRIRIDDIEDNSKLRRGVPVAHHIFGVASTINCANYVYFESLAMLYKLHNSTAIGVFVGKSRDERARDSD